MNQINFSRSQTESLKGIFAVGVVICHLCSRTGLGASIGLGPIYTALGYWGVSIFLFISGYGLLSRYMTKREKYLSDFMRNRIFPIYCLNILLIVNYALLKWLVGKEFTMRELLMSFGFGETIVQFGWYLQVCMLFYLFFYLSFRWIKTISVGILLNTLLVLIYCLICNMLNVSSTWYECSFAMVAGMTMQLLSEKMAHIPLFKKSLQLTFWGIIFSAMFVLCGSDLLSENTRLLCKILSSMAFALTIYFACCFVPLKGRILQWLGNHYLEIYVLQGVGIILADRFVGRENAYIYFCFCFILTFILATIFKEPMGSYMMLVKKK